MDNMHLQHEAQREGRKASKPAEEKEYAIIAVVASIDGLAEIFKAQECGLYHF